MQIWNMQHNNDFLFYPFCSYICFSFSWYFKFQISVRSNRIRVLRSLKFLFYNLLICTIWFWIIFHLRNCTKLFKIITRTNDFRLSPSNLTYKKNHENMSIYIYLHYFFFLLFIFFLAFIFVHVANIENLLHLILQNDKNRNQMKKQKYNSNHFLFGV